MKRLLYLIIVLAYISSCTSSKVISSNEIISMNYQEVIGENPENGKKPDSYAMFPNGLQGIYQEIGKNLRYPEKAQKKGVQGKVLVDFHVSKKGNITEITVIKSVSPEIDAEAIRVVKKLNNWVPGKLNGKAVKVRYKLPLNFKLQ